jgi:hypothetical protein
MARYQLRKEPLCAMCLAEGLVVAARIADTWSRTAAIRSSSGMGKLQSLCAHCHESRKKRLEHRGYDNAIGADGLAARSAASGLPHSLVASPGRELPVSGMQTDKHNRHIRQEADPNDFEHKHGPNHHFGPYTL